MKHIILFILSVLFTSSVGLYHFAHKYPYYVLEFQLMGKNLENPEQDAKLDLEQGNIYCFSTAGYARHFPGIATKADYKICKHGAEKQFFGNSDVLMNDRHSKAFYDVHYYALRYNSYVVANASE